MMLTIYKNILHVLQDEQNTDIKTSYETYITQKQNFYTKYPRLALIEILSLLFDYREDKNDQHVLHDVYQRYASSRFLVNNLREEDMQYIMKRYLEEVSKSREEGVKMCAVQKIT